MEHSTGQQHRDRHALMMAIFLGADEVVITTLLKRWPICLDTFKKFFIYIFNKSFVKMLGIPVTLGISLHGCSGKCFERPRLPVKMQCR